MLHGSTTSTAAAVAQATHRPRRQITPSTAHSARAWLACCEISRRMLLLLSLPRCWLGSSVARMLRVTVLSIIRLVSRPPTPPDKRLAACDSVTRALLPACVRVTERQRPHQDPSLDASRSSTARPRHTYTINCKSRMSKTCAVTTTHIPDRAPERRLRAACLSPAIVTFLDFGA